MAVASTTHESPRSAVHLTPMGTHPATHPDFDKEVLNIMRIDWQRAILAGIAGTIAFDVLGWLLTGWWWDIPTLLGTKLGIGLLGGALAHYANGAILAVVSQGGVSDG